MITSKTVSLSSCVCAKCGVVFAMPEHMMNSAKKTRETVYCPNGHLTFLGKTEADKLREQLTSKQAELDRARAASQEEFHLRLVVERSLYRERKKSSKLKRRIAAGVCPCCNQSFGNIHRHMETKHPEFKKA